MKTTHLITANLAALAGAEALVDLESACTVEALQGALPSNATILSAVTVANGSSYGQGAADLPYSTDPTNLPENCAVIVNVTSSASSSYTIGLFLPTDWNGRFLQVGQGVFAGGINWLDMGAGLQYGFAVASTNTGHNSSLTDASWALNEPEKQLDWGYRAIHGSVVLGKALTESYYGQSIAYSYYNGASTGGRQGLREAEYDATSFDGLLVGAAAWWTSHLHPWITKFAIYNLDTNTSTRIPAALFDAVGAEVLEQCDPVDGLVDNIISSPELCDFNSSALLCGSPGRDDSNCLTAAQLTTLDKIYGDYYADDEFAFPGVELGTEEQYVDELSGTEPTATGQGYIKYFVLNDSNWDWNTYDDSLVWEADAADPGSPTADHYEAFEAVKESGSKILMYHGMSDGIISTRSSNIFYSRVADALGGYDQLRDWFRLFLVPGMQHVDKTPTAVNAPWYFAGANSQAQLGTDIYSVPGFEDAEHDALLALMNWVENNVTVDSFIATTWNSPYDPSSGVYRQRPICPYPQKAVYDGTGDVDAASSWSCPGF
ncbi:hypothetical protein SLS53_006087 [Cytospora paraplurivora]|uniref:Carboxylic ester hydrolase n=1 Tax=Cytospora paraplurivora TaxID=2898453 RepID=A0AAN9YDU0_9PEZI